MQRVWILCAAACLALSAAPAPLAAVEGDGSVTALSVVPASGKTEVVVGIAGDVDVADFTLEGPDRIVLDLQGAVLGAVPALYDKVQRGGITNIRFAQYAPDVVRVVIELDGQRPYQVVRGERDVRVIVDGSSTASAAWHATSRPADAPSATAKAVSARAASAHAASSRVAALRPSAAPQPRITVTYHDADVRDVLAAFSAFSGRTIVVGKDIKGSVSAEIRDQPWDIALKAILTTQGLAASEDDHGIIMVDSYENILNKQASEPLVTRMVPINYARAGALVSTITSLLARDCKPAPAGQPPQCITRGSITADTATNTLVITEVNTRIDDILNYVRALDVRTPQVAIKAKIIIINRTALEQYNIGYDLGAAGGTEGFNFPFPRVDDEKVDAVVTLGGGSLIGVANARSRIPSAALRLLYTTMIGNFSLTSFIDATQSLNVTDVQAEPSIVTLDNREAQILVGEETPVRVVDAGAQGQVRANVEFKETGIILLVTPHITNNRRILLKVHAERSNIEQGTTAELPFFFRKERADNQLLVADGETAVIGGLTRTAITRSKTGIPFLSGLPIVGNLFSSTLEAEVKQDLLILITPHIVDDGEIIDEAPER